MPRSYLVLFFHRGKWEVYEEYGPTMADVAVKRAAQLSGPFGNAEVHALDGDGVSIWVREYK